MACEKHLHSNLGNQPLKLLKWFATPLGENLLYLTKRAKSRGKDLKPEILIRKTTIVRGRRESSMTVSLREIDRRKSFIRRIGGKKVSKLAISIRLKQLDLILHLIYVIKSWKKFGKRRERENLFPPLIKFLYCHTPKWIQRDKNTTSVIFLFK